MMTRGIDMAAIIEHGPHRATIANGRVVSDNAGLQRLAQAFIDTLTGYHADIDIDGANAFVAAFGGRVVSVDLPEYGPETAGRVY
jgi:hypothetical protein